MKEKILELRAQGKTYKEIRILLGCSKSTISYHCGERQDEVVRHEQKFCKTCNSKVKSFQEFCNNQCYLDYKIIRTTEDLINGLLQTNSSIKRGLCNIYGEVCSICSTPSFWNGKFLSLQVDHINGNSDDNTFKNLRLVCPNCHSQLPTSRGGIANKKTHKRNEYLRKHKGYM